jgi:hypothetical protein
MYRIHHYGMLAKHPGTQATGGETPWD